MHSYSYEAYEKKYRAFYSPKSIWYIWMADLKCYMRRLNNEYINLWRD